MTQSVYKRLQALEEKQKQSGIIISMMRPADEGVTAEYSRNGKPGGKEWFATIEDAESYLESAYKRYGGTGPLINLIWREA